MGREGSAVCTGSADRWGLSVDADLADRVGGADRGGKVDFVDFVCGLVRLRDLDMRLGFIRLRQIG